MNALATIADQSTTADGVRGWVFVAAVIIIGGTVTAVLAARWNLTNVPVMGDEPSTLDRADGIGQQCRRSGHYYQLNLARTATVTGGAVDAAAEERWFAELDDAMQDYLTLYAQYVAAPKSERSYLEALVHDAKRDIIDRFRTKETGR